MIIENPDDSELKDKCEGLTCTLSNTFQDFYHWIRCELADLECVQEAIAEKERIMQTKIKLESKKKSEQSELDSLNNGKKLLKNIFKSASTIQSRVTALGHSIENIEKEIQEYNLVVKMLDYNIAENIIPKFKTMQVSNYFKFLNHLAKSEVNNCAALTTFWGDLMKNSNVAAVA